MPFVPDGRSRKDLVFAGARSARRDRCAPRCSARSGRAARPIRRSSRRCRGPTTSSSGSSRSLSLLPPYLETPALLVGPVVGIARAARAAVPRRRGREELAPAARWPCSRSCSSPSPLGTLDAARRVTAPVVAGHGRLERGARCPLQYLQGRTAARAAGRARASRLKQCRNCHALGGEGGRARAGARRRRGAPHAATSSSARSCRAAATCPPTASSLSPRKPRRSWPSPRVLHSQGPAKPARDSAEPAARARRRFARDHHRRAEAAADPSPLAAALHPGRCGRGPGRARPRGRRLRARLAPWPAGCAPLILQTGRLAAFVAGLAVLWIARRRRLSTPSRACS